MNHPGILGFLTDPLLLTILPMLILLVLANRAITRKTKQRGQS